VAFRRLLVLVLPGEPVTPRHCVQSKTSGWQLKKMTVREMRCGEPEYSSLPYMTKIPTSPRQRVARMTKVGYMMASVSAGASAQGS